MPPFFFVETEEDDPAAGLRQLAAGQQLRVYCNEPHADSYSDDRHLLVVQLRGVADKGLVAMWNREAERVTKLLPWESIQRVEVRLRAARRGTSYGVTLALALGACGSVLDAIPGGDRKSHVGLLGVALGIAIGLLVWRGSSEWTVVYGSAKD